MDLRRALNDSIVPFPAIQLSYLIKAYEDYPDKDNFFISYINLLAGSDNLEVQIRSGMKDEEIRETWQNDLNIFKNIRRKYLLYTDFE